MEAMNNVCRLHHLPKTKKVKWQDVVQYGQEYHMTVILTKEEWDFVQAALLSERMPKKKINDQKKISDHCVVENEGDYAERITSGA